MDTAVKPGMTRHVTAGDIKPGHTIVERTERGSVTMRAVVTDTNKCTGDPSNVHVWVKVPKTTGEKLWCYFTGAPVEIAYS